MTDAPGAPVRVAQRLLQLAAELRDAARQDRVDLMAALLDQRQACIDELADLRGEIAQPARDLLCQVAELDAETERMVAAARDATVAELARVRHGREALRGYLRAADPTWR